MNKKELAEKLAKKCDLSKAKAQEIVQTLFDTKPGHGIIAVELDAGREVQILGFGTFGTKRRSARRVATRLPARRSPSRPSSTPSSRPARVSRTASRTDRGVAVPAVPESPASAGFFNGGDFSTKA